MERIKKAAQGKTARSGGLNVTQIREFLNFCSVFTYVQVLESKRKDLNLLLKQFLSDETKREVKTLERYEEIINFIVSHSDKELRSSQFHIALRKLCSKEQKEEEEKKKEQAQKEKERKMQEFEKQKERKMQEFRDKRYKQLMSSDQKKTKENYKFVLPEILHGFGKEIHPEQYFERGLCFLFSFGTVAPDEEKAYDLFTQAANQQYWPALVYQILLAKESRIRVGGFLLWMQLSRRINRVQIEQSEFSYKEHTIGLCYMNGFGDFGRNREMAQGYFESDQTKSFSLSQWQLYQLVARERKAKTLACSVKSNNTDAIAEMGSLYQEGKYGLEKDINRAIQLYQQGAEFGCRINMMSLAGLLYEKNTKKSLERCLWWCQKILKKVKKLETIEVVQELYRKARSNQKSWDAEVIEKQQYLELRRAFVVRQLYEVTHRRIPYDLCLLVSDYEC